MRYLKATRAKTVRLTVRVRSEMAEGIAAEARENGMTTPDFVRHVFQQRLDRRALRLAVNGLRVGVGTPEAY